MTRMSRQLEFLLMDVVAVMFVARLFSFLILFDQAEGFNDQSTRPTYGIKAMVLARLIARLKVR